jgi:preprotein translocase subunit SecA
VQIIAALAMDRGAVVEMHTGEGKTLAAVMPAALNALAGQGAHVLTVNDYLARRDAEWMRPVYARLGLEVAFVQQGMSPDARRQAYLADVTYLTAKEAGFDHLRDLLATSVEDLVHRPFHFALVDEADSLLIDEARVPLVVAGRMEREVSTAERMARLVRELVPGVHYQTSDYGRDVELTDAGIARAELELSCGSLHDVDNYARLTELNCALHAGTGRTACKPPSKPRSISLVRPTVGFWDRSRSRISSRATSVCAG